MGSHGFLVKVVLLLPLMLEHFLWASVWGSGSIIGLLGEGCLIFSPPSDLNSFVLCAWRVFHLWSRSAAACSPPPSAFPRWYPGWLESLPGQDTPGTHSYRVLSRRWFRVVLRPQHDRRHKERIPQPLLWSLPGYYRPSHGSFVSSCIPAVIGRTLLLYSSLQTLPPDLR